MLRGGRTYRLALAGQSEEANLSGDLDVTDSLTIRSSNRKRATIDGARIDRVIDTGAGFDGALRLVRLVVRGGELDAIGAGVLARGGTLLVRRSRVVANETKTGGGGVAAAFGARARIERSTLSRNRSGGGGGLAILPGSHADVIASTVAHNSGVNGGGIDIGRGAEPTLTVVNSTVAHNTATGSGGGINAAAAGTVVIRNSTVTRNRANTAELGGQQGGGIAACCVSPVVVRNSIIALNRVADPGTGPDCGFATLFVSAGRNLIGDPAQCGALAGPPNIVSATPRLGKLRANGGPTQTVALGMRSPAIDRAGAGATQRDQRGVRRKRPDIGAFERRQSTRP